MKLKLFVSGLVLIASQANISAAQSVDRTLVQRGEYLAAIMACTHCHTPGHFLGKEDTARHLGGSEVGFSIPGLGIFYGPNLTNDKATGLGNWTDAQIVKALKAGERPDGRVLAPAMPWQDFAGMTDADLNAVVAYLRSLPVVVNKVPGPFGPGEPATSFVMKVVPPPG
jgi:mono/diheme cytochrome c family protein